MPYRKKRFAIKCFYVAIDIVLSYLAIYLACFLRRNSLPFSLSSLGSLIAPANPYREVFALWILLILVFTGIHRLYQTRREIFEGFEVWLVLRAVALASISTIVVSYVLKVEGLPRSVILLGSTLTMAFFSVWRIGKRIFVEYLVCHGYNNQNVLIVGAGRVGTMLAEEIKRNPGLGLRVVGFLDDFKDSIHCNGYRVLGKILDFEKTVHESFIDQVFITIHHDSKVFLALLEKARDLGVAFRVIPQGFGLASGEFLRYNIGVIPILEYSGETKIKTRISKKIFDFTISLFATILLFPFFAVIGVMILLDSPGPIFYFSKRYGRNGQVFRMYKFRTMCQGADVAQDQLKGRNEADGPIFKIKNDPRITRIGRFLRRYSLDELPQVLNVLKGEMSLVGPRPLPIDQIEREDLRQLKRLGVKPGITGLWQIRGRSDVSFRRLIRWDMWYINNWSFWLDFNIILQTIPVVLKGRGAY